jgi:NUMOD3 motif
MGQFMNLHEQYPDFFIDNKYLKYYQKIVSSPTTDTNHEKHHIVPKSIWKNNILVNLTHRQHYIAHLLLVKCVSPKYRKKMLYAVTAMKFKVMNDIKFNSRVFEKLKIEANLSRATLLSGVPRSEETKQKIREKRALQVTTDETRAKMSAARKGRKQSASAIEKTRLAHLGSKRSEETKQRLRESREHYPRLTCPHCSKTMVTVNYNRWHGDKCKSLLNDGA